MRASVHQVRSGPPWGGGNAGHAVAQIHPGGGQPWQEPSPWQQQMHLPKQGVRTQETAKAEHVRDDADIAVMGVRGPGPGRRNHCPIRKGSYGDRTGASGLGAAKLNKRLS